MSEIETFQEYRQHIKFLAEQSIEEAEEYDTEISEVVWENVDSDSLIIYFGNNLKVLEWADNEPEEWKHLVDDSSNYREVLQAMAYRAMEADVWDEVHRIQDEE